MMDFLKKTTLIGLGLALLAKDKIEEFVEKAKEESKLSEEEARKLLDELLDKSEKAKNDLESKIDEMIKNALKKYGVASAEDIKRLEDRIAELEKNQK